MLVEDERAADGTVARVATVFLTGRECPVALRDVRPLAAHHRQRHAPRVPSPAQIAAARRTLDDGHESRVTQHEALQRRQLLRSARGSRGRLRRHRRRPQPASPASSSNRIPRWWAPGRRGSSTALESRRRPDAPAPALEVAMGLETAHPDALERLQQADDGRGIPARGGRTPVDGRGAPGVPAGLATVCAARRTGRVASAIDRRGARCRGVGDLAHPDAHRKRRARGARATKACFASRGWRTSSGASRSRTRVRPAAARGSSPISGIWIDSRLASRCLDARRDRLRAMNLEQRVLPQPALPRSARNSVAV